VAARLTEPTDQPLSSQVAGAGETVRVRPHQGAPLVAMLDAGAELPVLGRYEGYLYVQAPDGHLGWVDAATDQ
jgi:hypothetical protein